MASSVKGKWQHSVLESSSGHAGSGLRMINGRENLSTLLERGGIREQGQAQVKMGGSYWEDLEAERRLLHRVSHSSKNFYP